MLIFALLCVTSYMKKTTTELSILNLDQMVLRIRVIIEIMLKFCKNKEKKPCSRVCLDCKINHVHKINRKLLQTASHLTVCTLQ